MTRARARRIDAARHSSPVEPFSAVRRPSALDDCHEPAARAILETGQLLVIGPGYLLQAGGYVAAARWDGVAFRVLDTTGDCRGVFASWPAAAGDMLMAAAEWNKDARFSAA